MRSQAKTLPAPTPIIDRCAGTCSAASSTTTATSACAGAWPADLAARGETVRLWVDDRVARWTGWRRRRAPASSVRGLAEPRADIDAGRCRDRGLRLRPAAGLRRAHGRATRPPVWINLEYLSAEDYVERSHGLPSPQFDGPAAGLRSGSSIPASRRAPAACCASPICSSAQQALRRRAPGCARAASSARPRRARGQPVLLRATPALAALLDSLADDADAAARHRRRWRARPGRCARSAPTGRARPLRAAASAAADPARLRPPAVGLRPELRARRRFVRARAVGRRAVRLADLPAARRRARAQARRLPRPLPGRRAERSRSGDAVRACARSLERPRRRGPHALPAPAAWQRRAATWRDDAWQRQAGPDQPAARLRRPKDAKMCGFARHEPAAPLRTTARRLNASPTERSP